MGRIGVDLYPLQVGVELARVETFGKFLGGSATNVAVAAARLGRRVAVITRTGADPFGEYLRRELREFGVDDRWVGVVDGLPTPVTFCEIFPPDDFPLYFYRQPVAPDLVIEEGELDLEAVRAARIFWVTGTGLCAEPSRGATLAAMRARGAGVHPRRGSAPDPGLLSEVQQNQARQGGPPCSNEVESLGEIEDTRPEAAFGGAGGGAPALRGSGSGAGAPPRRSRKMSQPGRGGVGESGPPQATRSATVFDLDWRPMFWGGEDPRPHYAAALAHTTIAIGNIDEVEIATGEREPLAAAHALLDHGVELAVVKQGPKGVLALHRDGTTVEAPPVPVEVVNGLGAGDAFGGALCHGLLSGWDLDRTVRYANAAGAIVASRLACSTAMPYPPEVEALLDGGTPRP
ncbi:5-dehydro-2-deoxygluconokinase [Streptomyces sp. NPDC050738]|uniref:5-dehydro-2-deoxygluconokinase n=1 Tax=Streptomyces sp. NPDC050738 TaxID=3154744 RepID=UPI0034284EDD